MSKWKQIIGKLAPVLATALGGPLAGTATKFLAGKLLGNPDASESELEIAISGATPELLAEIKQMDQDFELQMRQLDIDVYDMDVKDRTSARDMAKTNMWPQIVLSTLFVIGYFGIIYLFLTGTIEMEDDVKPVIMVLVGVLTAAIPQILNFWLGSSHSSKVKTAILGKK